jgi:hypothetical protein
MSKLFIFVACLSSILHTVFSVIHNSKTFKPFELHEITDGTINNLVGDGKGENLWLLMFYLEKCPYCKVAKDALSTLTKRDELGDESFINLKIGQIDCTQNNWSCLRFNITRVPTIVLLKHEKLFDFKNYVTDENLLRFLAEEKFVHNGKDIPEPYGMINIVSRVFTESVNVLNERIGEFVNKTLKVPITWTPTYTIILLIIFMILIIVVEYHIINRFCVGKRIPKVHRKEENKEEVKVNQKSEEKKEDVSNKEKKE